MNAIVSKLPLDTGIEKWYNLGTAQKTVSVARNFQNVDFSSSFTEISQYQGFAIRVRKISQESTGVIRVQCFYAQSNELVGEPLTENFGIFWFGYPYYTENGKLVYTCSYSQGMSHPAIIQVGYNNNTGGYANCTIEMQLWGMKIE